MAIVQAKNWKGEVVSYHLDNTLKENLDRIKEVVTKSDMDYIFVNSGLPGMGESNFSIEVAAYLDPNFTIDNVCFTADDFIEKTSSCPKFSAIVLDESFASLNNKISLTKDFIRIVHHLQIIRQKCLFIALNLPNFFDLNKGIAIYRAHHLFVCYGDYGTRGSFAAFDRDRKRELYVKGAKFMNYLASSPNFRGKFVKQKVIDEEEYNKLKIIHLKSQNFMGERSLKSNYHRDLLICYMVSVLKYKQKFVADIIGLTTKTVERAIIKCEEEIKIKYLDNNCEEVKKNE